MICLEKKQTCYFCQCLFTCFLGFLCIITAEILNLVFFFCQLWKFQQKYRYINCIIEDVLEVIGVTHFPLKSEINGKCLVII